jgi:hypothetical protein
MLSGDSCTGLPADCADSGCADSDCIAVQGLGGIQIEPNSIRCLLQTQVQRPHHRQTSRRSDIPNTDRWHIEYAPRLP